MNGYASRARELGVSIETGRRAVGIRVNQHKVTGVETDQGLIATPVVVNAAGADATEVGKWVGLNIPILNLTRSI